MNYSNQNGCFVVEPPEALKAGNHICSHHNPNFLQNGHCKFSVQKDGNIVAYSTHHGQHKAIWASNSNGKGRAPYYFCLQEDANMVLYDQDHKCVWSSGSYGHGANSVLRAQDDGNVVLYNSAGKAIWATGTWKYEVSQHYGQG